MKKKPLIAIFLVFCLMSMHSRASDLNLIEDIKSAKPFVCEVIPVELNQVSESPVFIVDAIPSEWKKENAGLQLSLGYIDQNKIDIPNVGVFALKNRYSTDDTMDLQYGISLIKEHGDRIELTGNVTIFIGKWLVLAREANLPEPLKNENSATDRRAIAIRLWNQ